MIFVVFFQFRDVVKRKRWLRIDNNLSASKTWLVVDGLAPGPYMLDCNRRLSLWQAWCDWRAGIISPERPARWGLGCCQQLARCGGSDAGRVWRLNCAHCGGHCTKTADARLEIMKLESLNLGNRSESLWLTVLCPASTLIRWHFWPLDGGDFGRLFFFGTGSSTLRSKNTQKAG